MTFCSAKPPAQPSWVTKTFSLIHLFNLVEGSRLAYFRNGLTKEFTKMNFDCDTLENPHISLSAGATSATHNLSVFQASRRVFTRLHLFVHSHPTPPHPLQQSAGAGAESFWLQDIDNFHSSIWGWTAAPHSSPPPSLLPRHLVWLLPTYSQHLKGPSHHH